MLTYQRLFHCPYQNSHGWGVGPWRPWPGFPGAPPRCRWYQKPTTNATGGCLVPRKAGRCECIYSACGKTPICTVIACQMYTYRRFMHFYVPVYLLVDFSIIYMPVCCAWNYVDGHTHGGRYSRCYLRAWVQSSQTCWRWMIPGHSIAMDVSKQHLRGAHGEKAEFGLLHKATTSLQLREHSVSIKYGKSFLWADPSFSGSCNVAALTDGTHCLQYNVGIAMSQTIPHSSPFLWVGFQPSKIRVVDTTVN